MLIYGKVLQKFKSYGLDYQVFIAKNKVNYLRFSAA
jgi:hypothetical protein